MNVKDESEKAGLKLNVKKKTKIMVSGPITSWQIEGEKVKAVTDFILGGSKITVDGVYICSSKYKCESESEVAQSCPTLSDPMDCSLPTDRFQIGKGVHQGCISSLLI